MNLDLGGPPPLPDCHDPEHTWLFGTAAGSDGSEDMLTLWTEIKQK